MSKQYTEQPLLEFNPKLPRLSKNERQVLKLLIEAGKLIVPIYLKQEEQIKEKGGFYPAGVSKEEVEKASRKDPNISSHYTVVEKINGKLVAIPYHIKYADFLKPVADKLNQASQVTDNKEFGRFLKLQAKALLEGNYEEAAAAWLKMKQYLLDISIGPVEHHDDRLFFAKASYQSWVGIVDVESTQILNHYKGIILSSQRKSLVPTHRLENYHQVRAKIVDVVLLSGHMARTKFVGVNLPMNLNWVEKYGSEITLLKQVNLARLKEQILPSFNQVFETAFKKGFSEADLKMGNISYIALHEIAHNYLYYKNASKNLQDLLSPIYELSATVLGIRMAGYLLLKDVITNKELESMIVAFISRSFYLIDKSKTSKEWVNYATGGAIFINFLLRSGALRQFKGLAIPNFMKIFVSLQDLLYQLEELLSSGTRKDAEAFINKYGLKDRTL